MFVFLFVLALGQEAPPPCDTPPRGYVQGSILVTVQPAGTAVQPFGEGTAVSPPLGGNTWSIAAGAGVFLTPRVALEGDFAFGGVIGVTQTFTFYGSTQTYRAENRDVLFNANVRWSPGGRRRVELVAGGGLAVSRFRQRNGLLTTTYPSPRQYPTPEYSERDDVLNLGGGLDFPIRMNNSVAILPGFRLRWVHRINDALSSSMAAGGLRLEAGAGIRGGFQRREFQPAQRGPTYLQGGFVFASHPAGTANHRVSPPLGGETFGLSASGGAFVTSAVAIEGEVVQVGQLSAPQRFSYNWRTDYTAEARDLLLGAHARFRPGASSPLDLIAGGGIAFTRLANRNQVTTYVLSPPNPPRRSPDVTFRERAPYAGGGLDVPIRLSARVSLVPMFRMRWIFREQEGESAYMGLGRVAFLVGVSLRLMPTKGSPEGPPSVHPDPTS
jgi:hypothetical protein